MRLLSLLLILALPSQPAGAIRIAGTVRDATGLVLPGATIEVDGTLAALSTEDGSFEIVLTTGSRARILVSLPVSRRASCSSMRVQASGSTWCFRWPASRIASS